MHVMQLAHGIFNCMVLMHRCCSSQQQVGCRIKKFNRNGKEEKFPNETSKIEGGLQIGGTRYAVRQRDRVTIRICHSGTRCVLVLAVGVDVLNGEALLFGKFEFTGALRWLIWWMWRRSTAATATTTTTTTTATTTAGSTTSSAGFGCRSLQQRRFGL